MINSIEGAANLYKLDIFMNKDIIKSGVDYRKKIEYSVANHKNIIGCAELQKSVYDEILDLLDVKDVVMAKPAAVQKPAPKPEVISGSTLADTFAVKNTVTPATLNIPSVTPAEREDYNRVIYGSQAAYDNELEQERMDMLEQIEELRSELNGVEGMNVRNIPQVTERSNINDIRNVLKLLLHKKNMGMYFETAKDVMMIGINKLIGFCDGRPGRPNLTGWDRTANLKLNSLKTEMAGMVSGFFKKYSIPPILQILFSLVPSAFLHASIRERQSGTKASSDAALQDLREMMK